MRFSSPHRSRGRPARHRCCGVPASVARLCIGILVVGLAATSGFGQRPGTPPPRQLFSDDIASDDEGLQIEAFLFRSESDNLIMMPGMTWDDVERLLDMDDGLGPTANQYSYQSLEISGTSTGNRAELQVQLQLTVTASLS